MRNPGASTPDRVAVCVFCRSRPVEHAWRPFCSERCKMQDLAHWATGTYTVPVEPDDEDRESSES